MQGQSKAFSLSRETPLPSFYLGRERLPLPVNGWNFPQSVLYVPEVQFFWDSSSQTLLSIKSPGKLVKTEIPEPHSQKLYSNSVDLS